MLVEHGAKKKATCSGWTSLHVATQRFIIFVFFLHDAKGWQKRPPFARRPRFHSTVGNDNVLSVDLTATGATFRRTLNEWKRSGRVRQWNTTVLDVRPQTSVLDVQLVARNAFSSSNYYQDIVDSARRNPDAASSPPLVVVSAASVLFGSLAVPLLPLGTLPKNMLGLASIFLPFLLLGAQAVSPGAVAAIFRSATTSATAAAAAAAAEEERIACHEAGHFLAGYLCGIAIRAYDVTGDRDAGTAIELEDEDLATLQRRTGNLLVVAMAGMVAETVRFGTSKGGAADLAMAYQIMRLAKVPAADQEGSLRWAVMKALTLMRLHRDALDAVTAAMKDRLSVADCIDRIERTSVAS